MLRSSCKHRLVSRKKSCVILNRLTINEMEKTMDIKITKTTCSKEKPEASVLGFGKYFTDHMFLMDYTPDKGWHDARIVPYGP